MCTFKFKGIFLAASSLALFFGGAVFASTDYSSAGDNSIVQSSPMLNSDGQNSEELFPEPVELRPNVFFWVNIYTKYNQNQAIVHDASDLNIHFEVVDLNVAVGPNASRRSWNRYMEQRKRYYREILRNVSRQHGECKTEEECRVAGLFGYQPDGKRFREAADDVRIQFGMADRFREGLITSGSYIYKMREMFQKHGLPEELLALPHVESSFNVKAYSKFGAAGVWQFTRSTGRLYMEIDYSVDERRDPFISTDAAARLLKRNYEDLGNWPLAITAYNHGRYGMLKAKKKYGSDIVTIIKNNDMRLFGFASRNFYAEFLAAKKITQNPERYFGPIGFNLPLVYDEVTFDHYVPISILYKHFGYSREDIMSLNPSLRMPIWDGTRRLPKGYPVKVPFGTTQRFKEMYASAPSDMLFDKQLIPKYYRVMRGDALSTIADRFRMSTQALMEYNNLRSRHRIYAGQNLKIPPENYKVAKAVYTEEPLESDDVITEFRVNSKKIEPIVKREIAPGEPKAEYASYTFNKNSEQDYDRDLVLLTKMKIFDFEPRPEPPSIA
ncbi:MAG: transglycosylase SLT domain-containing protein, partial [Nitrospinota bacterium]|nr:transglycosylase SLT domain-containing protein [Nitrospinota bacterium]